MDIWGHGRHLSDVQSSYSELAGLPFLWLCSTSSVVELLLTQRPDSPQHRLLTDAEDAQRKPGARA